ncbi:probable mitochondrial adenine nucleotide transporter BTL3 [Durio zibethinus]|uniref:Probable mitochondrial adenine nucleotide transporter BTL3 n=1 Tax=Durio zibethinus TaxID=66656 RepID=A0A6P5ZI47_DURZI|nr:probable mitochondrial adenine nucleotide transporter BTL3 [Durio zibethinus]
MYGADRCLFVDSIRASQQLNPDGPFLFGGLFLNDQTLPSSVVSFISIKTHKCLANKNDNLCLVSCFLGDGKSSKTLRSVKSRRGGAKGGWFLSVSLSREEGYVGESGENWGQNGCKNLEEEEVVEEEKEKVRVKKESGALNTTKHLWAGAVAAMVSRTFIAPLERLKLEYLVRGETKNLIELIKSIAAIEGLKGFWKGNFINILRTAPFKAINFYAYDTYRSQLLKLSGKKEATNFQRFLAGAAAGITAALLCLPMDTIRTVMVAPGGEALGGLIGASCHMIQTEGFFSLYKGLVPSIISMAPSGAVFYGVYDILKSGYLHSSEGRKRVQDMKQGDQELNALEQLELGPIRTLLYGAIAGACSEAATYPFEVVRRHLQMQVRATKLSALATCVKIVEQGGISALYAGLLPRLLQVLPSAAISYFVYEFMKIVLKVEPA